MKGTFPFYIAGVAKLADAQDLKSCGLCVRSGSNPDLRILRLLEVRKKTSPTSSVVAFSVMKFQEAQFVLFLLHNYKGY